MPKWNPMQEKAIYTFDKNILVSASAGSGKTTVLIARLLHLVQHKKIEISQILAMTFTEAAANEMKKRLAKELQNALLTCKEEEKSYLESQLANLSNSYISTIHGFCLNIIQNYYYTIGLDKKRVENIMDDAAQSALFQKAMKETMDYFMSQDDFVELCTLFSNRAESNYSLEETLLALFHLASAKSDPDTFLEECKIQHPYSQIHEMNEQTLFYFFDYLMVQIDSILETMKVLKFEYEEDKHIELWESKWNGLLSAKEALSKREYASFRELFLLHSKTILANVKDNDAVKMMKKEIDELENELHSILFTEEEYVSFANQVRPHTNLLVDACSYFLHRYNQLKEEFMGIDFSDMEHFALEILKANDGLVASLYREQFVEIMVDEFQDSNDVQDQLVRLICKDNNVFRVGDIKQSIYGFRHATPDIMRSLIDNKGEKDEVIYLSNNYRSKKSIVDFNNMLFHVLMNVPGFASAFNEYDHTQTGLASQEENNLPILFHMIDDKAINQKEGPFKKDELKSSFIAKEIIRLREEKGYNFKDFVVLVKTNAKSECLRTVFEQANIPYFINMKHGFYSSSALQNMISFLQALHNPHDDIAFCALLLSPFFMLSDSDLANACIHKEKEQSYYSYFKEHSDITTEFDSLYEGIKKRRLSEIICDIFTVNNYYEDYTTLQEKSNLDKLYEIVLMQEQKQFVSIASFLNTLMQSKDTQIGEAIPIGNNDDVVRVMSIHQSKGLQFPVVFLYSTSSVNIMDTKGFCAFDDSLHIAMNAMVLPHRLVYPTMNRIALNHKTTKAALEEEMRVLYVATTRAQNEMYIVDCGQEQRIAPLNKVEIYKKKGFSSWIIQAFSQLVSPLFRVQYIEEYWELPILESRNPKQASIPKYELSYHESISLSPSEFEFSFTPRAFSFYESNAMERGSELHHMVEVLPHTIINKEILLKSAEAEQIHLSNHDQQILLQLYQNNLFLTALQGEVHHEFPFMIEKNNDIMHGYMDFVSIFDSHIVLIDFKSDRNIDEKELLIRYQEQLHAYEEALHILYPNKNIQTYIYSFELHKMIHV